MNPRLRLIIAAALLTVTLVAQAAEPSSGESTLNTGTIAVSAVKGLKSCLRFRLVGVCLWLVCVGPYCSVERSWKYGHRNPDVVVSVTNGMGKNPWKEAGSIYAGIEASGASSIISSKGGSLLSQLGAIETGSPGAPNQNQGFGRKTNLSYRDAQAIGHPLSGEIYCPSVTSVLSPYFLSGLDAIGWRWELPEVIYPQSLIPGLREIGSWPLNTWGSVYPRSGWLIQTDEPKAAAVAAQRVGDIITRSAEPHLYDEVKTGGTFVSDQKLTWRPTQSLEEGNDKTGDWQMLTPGMSTECETFGSNDTFSVSGWAGGKVAAGGDYAWTLWRPYSCCEVKGIFITNIDFLPYP